MGDRRADVMPSRPSSIDSVLANPDEPHFVVE
jgi:hypothetical protein